MTVKELIALLEKCSPDKKVEFPDAGPVLGIIELPNVIVLTDEYSF